LFAFEQFFNFSVILALNNVHYVFGIVFVEFGGRADGRAGTAVYAGFQALFNAIIPN
jgi:hypothetical protein